MIKKDYPCCDVTHIRPLRLSINTRKDIVIFSSQKKETRNGGSVRVPVERPNAHWLVDAFLATTLATAENLNVFL